MEHKFLVLTEDLFEVRAFGVDPEFDHAARCVKASRNIAAALTFANVAQIDDNDIGVVHHIYQLRGVNLGNSRPGSAHHVR